MKCDDRKGKQWFFTVARDIQWTKEIMLWNVSLFSRGLRGTWRTNAQVKLKLLQRLQGTVYLIFPLKFHGKRGNFRLDFPFPFFRQPLSATRSNAKHWDDFNLSMSCTSKAKRIELRDALPFRFVDFCLINQISFSLLWLGEAKFIFPFLIFPHSLPLPSADKCNHPFRRDLYVAASTPAKRANSQSFWAFCFPIRYFHLLLLLLLLFCIILLAKNNELCKIAYLFIRENRKEISEW